MEVDGVHAVCSNEKAYVVAVAQDGNGDILKVWDRSIMVCT